MRIVCWCEKEEKKKQVTSWYFLLRIVIKIALGDYFSLATVLNVGYI